MVAINEILLPECTGEKCGGDSDTCTDSRVHQRNAENRAPVIRNHRSAPIPGRWMAQDSAQYINGANTYQFVDSPPVGNVGAEGANIGGAVGNAAPYGVPGTDVAGPIAGGAEALEPLLSWQVLAQKRLEYDGSQNINRHTDPLYEGAKALENHRPLAPAERAARPRIRLAPAQVAVCSCRQTGAGNLLHSVRPEGILR